MEKHILSLIKENNRVIIPNFGAFIVAKENGFTILFNNFLSFNDGLLIDYVASTESISTEQASDRVDAYVDTVKNKLDTTGEYIINGLGTFTKDATGILRFTQADDVNDENNIKDESELLDLDAGDNDGGIVEDTPDDINQVPEITAVNEEPLVEVEEDNMVEPAISEKDEPKVVSESKPTATNVTNKYIEEDRKRRNKSILILVITLTLIPIIVVILYFTVFNKEKEPTKKAVSTKSVEKPIVKDTLKLDEQLKGNVVAGPEVNKDDQPEVIKTVEIEKPHHLIVGSFKNVDNAERFIKSLNEKGYNECYMLDHNGMKLVSIQAFDKVFKAQEKQEEILNSNRIESWILTKRN
nr:hypothetical protein [uncultured Carboxylicivirga sp.]